MERHRADRMDGGGNYGAAAEKPSYEIIKNNWKPTVCSLLLWKIDVWSARAEKCAHSEDVRAEHKCIH